MWATSTLALPSTLTATQLQAQNVDRVLKKVQQFEGILLSMVFFSCEPTARMRNPPRPVWAYCLDNSWDNFELGNLSFDIDSGPGMLI